MIKQESNECVYICLCHRNGRGMVGISIAQNAPFAIAQLSQESPIISIFYSIEVHCMTK